MSDLHQIEQRQLIAAKKPNNPAAVMSVNKKKGKKEEINNLCSFKESSLFNFEFSV